MLRSILAEHTQGISIFKHDLKRITCCMRLASKADNIDVSRAKGPSGPDSQSKEECFNGHHLSEQS